MSPRQRYSAYLDAPVPLAMAHRGGALLTENAAIENTLTAFRNAVALGFEYLETDVHVSRDGVVYAFHDLDLGRLAELTDTIAAMDSSAVDAVRLAGREPIPRLHDVLMALPEARFNIDVKSDAAVEPTLAVLRAAGGVDRVCLASFSGARLRLIRALCPEVATSLSPAEVALLRLAPVRALQSVGARRGAVCVQVPVRRGRLKVVTQGFLRRAHRLGLQVHVWTVDDPDEMRWLLGIGVDGLVTDRPDVLRDVLTERGAWRRR